MRAIRQDLPDCQAYNTLMKLTQADDEPLESPEERLRQRLRGLEAEGRVHLGYVLEDDDQPVGMVICSNIGQFPPGGRPIGVWTMVHPDHRGKGYGRRLFDAALARVRELEFDLFYTSVREGNEAGQRFAQLCGFREVDRQYKLSLDITKRSADMVMGELDEGVQLISIRTLRETEPNWAEQLRELCEAFWDDLPSRFEIGFTLPKTVKAFESMVLAEFEINMDSSVVALVDGTWAATAWLSTPEEGVDWCFHQMTGVRPEFRRRGLVKAMKRFGFAWAKQAGIHTIHTYQHDTNKPMLTLNMDLGFVIDSCTIVLTRGDGCEG
jgi:RimJ/RimL family protein N-acetyltransferase